MLPYQPASNIKMRRVERENEPALVELPGLPNLLLVAEVESRGVLINPPRFSTFLH